MKKTVAFLMTILLAVAVSGLAGCSEPQDETLEVYVPAADAAASFDVMTINMLYEIRPEDDYIQYKGQSGADYTMEKRFARLCALVDYSSPDVLMLQEINGRGGWWDYLIDGSDSFLEKYSQYAYVGSINNVGGTNGSGGEDVFYNQIYYNKNKFDLVAGGTFFCRDDKTKPENQYTGDYEGQYSIHHTTTCTYAVLREKKTNVTVVFGTTHLCTRSGMADNFRSYGQARNLTEGLYDIAVQYKWGNDPLPIVVGGDFNGPEADRNFLAYTHMTEEAGYDDSQKIASETDNSGTARIFGAAVGGAHGSSANGSRIDYIFTQGASVEQYRVMSGTFAEDAGQTYCDYYPDASLDGSQYDLTDHLPVFIKAEVKADGKSEAPQVYVNERSLQDASVTEDSPLHVTQTKLTCDSVRLLEYTGSNLEKGFSAAVVEDGAADKCLRIMAEKSRVDFGLSIDYAALMRDSGLQPVSADNYTKVRIEYSYSLTNGRSRLYFGGSTSLMVPLSVGINAYEVTPADGLWTVQTFDFSDNDFWSGEIAYLGVITDIGLYAGDAIYIRSIELLP